MHSCLVYNHHTLSKEAWDIAEKISKESGFQFVDRYGNVQNKKGDDSLVSQILSTYCTYMGINYE